MGTPAKDNPPPIKLFTTIDISSCNSGGPFWLPSATTTDADNANRPLLYGVAMSEGGKFNTVTTITKRRLDYIMLWMGWDDDELSPDALGYHRIL